LKQNIEALQFEQCQINHGRGSPAARPPPTNYQFFTTLFLENVLKPQVSCRPTRNVWFKR